MNEALLWLVESAGRITVAGILFINLFVILYGVQKKQRWWVPGWMMTNCETEKDELQKKVDEYIAKTQAKLDRLEELEDERSRTRTRR